MKVASKFLTGDVRIHSIESAAGGLKVSGLIKETYPIEIELDAEDFREMLPLMVKTENLMAIASWVLSGLSSK